MTSYPIDPAVFETNDKVCAQGAMRGFIMHLDGGMIKVAACIENSSKNPFKEMVSHFTDDNARFAVLSVTGKTADGAKLRQDTFVYWVGPKLPVMQKMSYTSQKDFLKSSLPLVFNECPGKNDDTRPWILDCIQDDILKSMYGRPVARAGNGEYSFV